MLELYQLSIWRPCGSAARHLQSEGLGRIVDPETNSVNEPAPGTRPIAGLVVSHRRRFVFIHVPKTAGGSLKRALLAQCDDAVSPGIAVQRVQQAIGNHFQVAIKNALARHIQSGPLRYFVTARGHPTAAMTLLCHPTYYSYRKFAFVRNPFDRIVSSYEYARQEQGYEGEFADYVRNCRRYLPPQVNSVFFYRRKLVDWIGRFETLDDDLEYLSNWLELPRLALGHRNRTVRARYDDYMTPSLKRLVVEAYSSDFAAFNYARD